MIINRIVEYSFFFGLLVLVGYLVWAIMAPFVSALALSAIIVTICYPMYERVLKAVPGNNKTIAALLTTFAVLLIVILPLTLLTRTLLNEAVDVYRLVNNSQNGGIEASLQNVETTINVFFPSFQLDISEYLKQITAFVADNLGAIFAGTASTLLSVFIAIIGSFYFFRDGQYFTKQLINISPLPNDQDELILKRLATAVRSVATGTVLVALIQGALTAFGLWWFGFERAILWGTIAAFGALIPGVGTSIVFIPIIAFLVIYGAYLKAVLVFAWAALAVGLIDNFLGPYLMSRGNTMHPFVILLSVLGGIALFGPIGFIVGPVILSFFIVLLELYSVHISDYTNNRNDA